MSSELQTFARLRIKEGMLDEYKRLSALCMESVRTKDTGTLQYETYFSPDNTECLVFERYRDSESLIEHFKNLGDLYNQVLETCSGAGEVCGNASPELVELLKGSPVAVYKPFMTL
jgi:quinol monooxygenase YgiN